jgi:RNA polymerase sigma-70 factor, ECF subfamily
MRIRRSLASPRSARSGSAPARTATFEAEALAQLDSLYRTARRLTRNPADAEDLVQETFLKAFRAADRFEPGTNLRAWLFTILHNAARNRARDRVREALTVDSDIVEQAAELAPGAGQRAPGETPESLLLRDTLGPELQSAIDALPDAFREAVWLRDVEEFSYSEIASMLSIPVGTVMSRISRGRQALYARLQSSLTGRRSPVTVGDTQD